MISAVCHDHLNLVNGTLEQITDSGCELKCTAGSTSPALPKRSNVILNLLDEDTGKGLSFHARLIAVYRQDGCWIYRIRWKERPSIL